MQYGNVLNDDCLGLSVAAGVERILFYIANKCQRIVASDIYGYGSFASLEANGDFLKNQEKFACYPYRKECLKAVSMNALDLRFPDNTFDYVICLSSIEHFGSMQNSIKAIHEMARVVRAGGLVFISTEVSLNGLFSTDVFTVKQIERLVKKSGLELQEPINWHISPKSLDIMTDMLTDDLNALPHINLRSYGAVFTSISIVLKKSGHGLKKSSAAFRFEQIEKSLAEAMNNEPLVFSRCGKFSRLSALFCSLLLRLQRFVFEANCYNRFGH